MRSVKKLFYTTIALTITSFFMKTVAVWFNVYLAGLVGSVGIGIFQLIMTVYAMSKTLSYGGMNLAATRLCIDDFDTCRHSMRRLLCCALMLGVSAALLLFFGAKIISIHWIMTEGAVSSLRSLAFSLPFVSLSASLNGYMTAARKMGRYSVIQLLEQVVKIVATVLLVGKRENSDTETAICLVCVAITISEVFSFAMALLCYLHDMIKTKMQKEGKRGFLRRCARIALPDAFGSYIRSGLNTVEHLLIPRGIRQSGANLDRAFSDYGTVQGMALPVLLYPSSILGVISSLLVPEIAECKVKKNTTQINYIINRVLHIAMIFSMMTMSVMFLFAKELSISIYGNDDAAIFLRLIAPLIPTMYLDMTTDGMLKGLDQQLTIMKINVIDSVLCVVLVAILVPKIAVDGFLITIYIAEIINFLLSFGKLSSESKLNFQLGKNLLKPLICSLGASYFARTLLTLTEKPTLNLVIAISAGVILYSFLLRLCGGISKEDSKWFKSLIKP